MIIQPQQPVVKPALVTEVRDVCVTLSSARQVGHFNLLTLILLTINFWKFTEVGANGQNGPPALAHVEQVIILGPESVITLHRVMVGNIVRRNPLKSRSVTLAPAQVNFLVA